MSTIKSVSSLTSVLKKPKISRKHLSRYSWLPDVLRIEGSIALRIAGPVLTVTVFASAVAYAWYEGHNVKLSNNVSPLLAVVVGLILVFRNSTSYDRFYEGRKDFGQLTAEIRNLTRSVWINVAVPPDSGSATGQKGISEFLHPPTLINEVAKGSTGGKMTSSQLRRKKIEALQLAMAFAYAVKHRLRGEFGFDYDDYRGILPRSIVQYEINGISTAASSPASGNGHESYQATGSLTPKMKKRRESDSTKSDDDASPKDTKPSPSRNNSQQSHMHFHSASVTLDSQSATTPLLSGTHRTVQFHAYPTVLKTPLPLVIAHELSHMIFRFKRDGYLETVGPAGTNAMNAQVQSMVVQMTNMERIATTPIPASYGIHLKQCVTLYLFALPFVLVADLQWKMIPVVTVVAFTLMGIEGIANEIEMPFGHDKTDLPLDNFCAEIKEEIDFTIARLPEGGEGVAGLDDGEGDD
ncbi:UPF0187-domain-containing protein [Fomitiporia mediterranea MF3/22]|uniref:UPF0187-domain-containing protein n=1 Tax=Fomitiporia mediterranea (strain MF3/22) TaxID=694068 RepID=UPI000440915F|nr:UPF0187-domain-containing protein [Fomitiporia mediterranea MF3/22]EJD01266.1 UPF0187-domain-containing protein [Fomitiporia mediterranea MF3/22]